MDFLFKPVPFIILTTLAIAVCIYGLSGLLFPFFEKKSASNRNIILRYYELMGVQTNPKKVTYLLFGLSFGLGGVFFFLFWPDVIAGLMFGCCVGIAGWNLPVLLVKSTYESRCNRFVEQMVDSLTIMANGIKTGSNPVQSMQRVTEIMNNPIRQEFEKVIGDTQLGSSFEEALNKLGERVPRPDVQMFVTAINILKETGGNLAETFETIVFVIRERQKIEKKIEAITSKGVMQGIIVMLVPFLIFVVFLFMDPAFIRPMYTTTMGYILLFVMLVLQVIGGIWIKKIVTIKV
ncbi:MAG: type II secretion system F family protein [Bdellovibrionaceae bacterium]|nr:type II secretion system F family protein [Pseudobdellovibrionaceae bacterium]